MCVLGELCDAFLFYSSADSMGGQLSKIWAKVWPADGTPFGHHPHAQPGVTVAKWYPEKQEKQEKPGKLTAAPPPVLKGITRDLL